MKQATIKDVAAMAGVSAATVSRALDDRPEISAETKEKVREACRCLGYVPNAAARGLTGRKTHVIGMVVPDVSNPYFSGMATAIEARAAQEGYRVLLSNSMRSEEQEIRAIDQFLARYPPSASHRYHLSSSRSFAGQYQRFHGQRNRCGQSPYSLQAPAQDCPHR